MTQSGPGGAGGILDGLGSSDFSGLPLPLPLGLSLVLQLPDVLHGEAEPAIGPAEHLETRNAVSAEELQGKARLAKWCYDLFPTTKSGNAHLNLSSEGERITYWFDLLSS